MKLRALPLVAGVVMLIAGFLMAAAVDRGVTRPWADGLRSLWAFTLIALILAGVLAVVVGVGVLSQENLAAVGDQAARVPSVAQYIAVYVGFLVITAGGAIYLESAHGIQSERSVAMLGGGLFLIASLGRPWWLLGTIRRLGWFVAIDSDRVMKALLIGVGLLLLILGLTGRVGAT